MKKPQNPNEKLESVIKDSELPSLAKDYAELAIDGVMDDGVLKDIPLLGTVIGVMKFGNSINRHLSVKKLYKFLFELHKIPEEKRIKKIDQINSSKKYQSTVGEQTFELLDKIESDGKPEIIGKLFKAVIEEKIDYLTYLRVAHIVKNIFFYDLEWLYFNTVGEEVISSVNDSIFTSGLTDTKFVEVYEKAKKEINPLEYNPIVRPASMDKGYNATVLSELGKILIEIGMNNYCQHGV